MIPPLKDWTFEPTPEGAVLTKGRARIAYIERRRPLLRLVDMIEADRRGAGVTAFEPTTTDEGEYGAIVDLGGGRTLGYVLLDDFCAVVDGVAPDAAGA